MFVGDECFEENAFDNLYEEPRCNARNMSAEFKPVAILPR
jgi:hypothetical protein